MSRTTKKPSPSEDLHKEVQNLKIKTTHVEADKVGWREGLRTLAASILFMLSVTAGGVGFVYTELKAEIRRVETMVEKTHEIAIQTDAKVQALINFSIAQQSGDRAAIDAARRALIDVSANPTLTLTPTPQENQNVSL